MMYYHSGVANAGLGIAVLVVKFSPQLLAYMLEDSDDSWSQCIMGERGQIVTTLKGHLKGHLIIWNPECPNFQNYAVRQCFVTCSIDPGRSGERGFMALDPWLLTNHVLGFA